MEPSPPPAAAPATAAVCVVRTARLLSLPRLGLLAWLERLSLALLGSGLELLGTRLLLERGP